MIEGLNYKGIVWRLVKAVHCSENDAWTAVNQAYLRLYENPPDEIPVNTAQWAELFFVTAKKWWLAWKLQPCIIEQAVATRKSVESTMNKDESDRIECQASELYGIAPAEHDEIGLITDLIGYVPKEYRIATLVVIKTLLDRPPTKPVSIETCRKILQANQIVNTSEMARQVFTYLTTLKEVL
jgi:hypothetical protein